MRYALVHDDAPSGVVDLSPIGRPPAEAVAEALRHLRDLRWSGVVRAHLPPGDPACAAVAGVLRVAEAEEGPRLRVLVTPAPRLVRASVGGGAAASGVVGDGPWAERLRRLVPPGGEVELVVVEPGPDTPIRRLEPDRVAEALGRAAPGSARGRPRVWVTSADHVVGRPFAAVSAAVSGALGAGGEGGVALGPLEPSRAAPEHGVRALDDAALASALRGACADPGARRVVLDVDWTRATAAFPHVRELAAALVAPPPRPTEALDAVREEAGRILGAVRPPLRVPLRELGLDSIGAGVLRAVLERRFGVALPPTVVLDHPTVQELAERLVRELR